MTLLTVGQRTLLFSGDAQIENWRHILGKADKTPEFRQRLADLDFYKFGHHGSRNATPKSFSNYLRDHRSDGLPPLMSTLSGFHGKKESTNVPSKTLITHFKDSGTFTTTEGLNSHLDLTASTGDRLPWTAARH